MRQESTVSRLFVTCNIERLQEETAPKKAMHVSNSNQQGDEMNDQEYENEPAEGDRLRKIHQLQSLLLIISETNFETFALMGQPCQKSILSLAFDLALEASPA